MNSSRKCDGQSSNNIPFPVSKESRQWLIMMKYMLECAEKSLTILDRKKEELDFNNKDLEKFTALCAALEEARHQMALLGRKFFEGSPTDFSEKLSFISLPQKMEVTKKAGFSQTEQHMEMEAENNTQKEVEKTETTQKDACLCQIFQEGVIKKSKTRQITVCSPLNKSFLANENCEKRTKPLKIIEPDKPQDSETAQGSENPEGSEESQRPQDPEGSEKHQGIFKNERKNEDKELPLEEDSPYIIKQKEHFPIPETGIGYELFYAMKRHRHKLAQIIEETDERQTYEQLLKSAISAALRLKKKGLNENSQVTVCVKDEKYACIPVLAALFIGAKLNGLDVTFNKADIFYFLRMTPPDILFIEKEKLEVFEEIFRGTKENIPLVIMDGFPEGHESIHDYLRSSDPDINKFRPYKADSMRRDCVLLFSSGTSGPPKTICLSHYTVLSQCCNSCASGAMHGMMVTYHSYYWISTIILLGYSILAGIIRVVPLPFQPIKYFELIDKYKIESSFLGPYECICLSSVQKPPDLDISSQRTLISGGSSMSETVFRRLQNIFPDCCIFQIYGQTEVAGILTWWQVKSKEDLALMNARPTSCGRPYAGYWYKIVDETTGQILGPYKEGEICVKSDTMIMNGYYNLDSSECFDKFGWLKTGDLGYYDEYHCFYVSDRLKELIKYRDWHIAPVILENILSAHPVVRRAVVVGIPHPVDGEHAMGLIILKEGVEEKTVNLEDIVDFVNRRVADRLRLRAGVQIIHSIPLTVNGKVKRRALRDAIINGSELK